MDSKIFNLGANKESLRTILSGFFEREGIRNWDSGTKWQATTLMIKAKFRCLIWRVTTKRFISKRIWECVQFEIERRKEQMQSENLLEDYQTEKFIEYTDGAQSLTEMDADFILKTMDHIQLFQIVKDEVVW